jgi:phosphatidylcholine synthase
MNAPVLTEVERPRISISHVYAWGVHLYTAMGLVVAGAIAYVLVSDSPLRFRDAFLLMAVGLIIDGTDGWFARRVRVTEVLPGFDGRRLDDLVDFLNYTFLPLLLIYQADLLPERQSGWLLVPLLASAYGFCQVSAKTDDGFFLGFPSYWNLVAFYLYALQPPGWATVTVLLTLSALTFVPARYLYPTQPGALNRISIILAGIWGAFIVAILWRWEDTPFGGATARQLTWVSLFYPAYYMLVSWALSVRYWLTRPAAKR